VALDSGGYNLWKGAWSIAAGSLTDLANLDISF